MTQAQLSLEERIKLLENILEGERRITNHLEEIAWQESWEKEKAEILAKYPARITDQELEKLREYYR
jgi:hypothetical protein